MTAPSRQEEIDARKRPPKRPEFNQLEVFLAVAETRSFAAAARQIGRDQPSVSRAIARLEEHYGVDLFERRRGVPVGLTPTGKAILPSVRLLLATIDRQMVRAIETAHSQSGNLNVGFYPGLGSGPLRDGLTDFAAACPDVHLQLVEALPRELHRQLNERSIDVMFLGLLPELCASRLTREPLWKEPLAVVLREDHALAAKETFDWHDVSTLSLLLRSCHGDLSGYQALLARIGEGPVDCALHDVSRGALLDMIEMGLGQTICLASAAAPRPGLAFRPIEDEKAYVTIEAIWPRTDRNPLRHRLLSFIRLRVARRAREASPSIHLQDTAPARATGD